jgi:predicted O-methyltransferase YrrM
VTQLQNSAPALLPGHEYGWRRRRVLGALGLRPALVQHTRAESELLMRYAVGAKAIVELGVAEGGSAAELRSVMSPQGRLYLVDPYEPGAIGLSMTLIVARRTVGRISRGRVDWVRARSEDLANDWRTGIDFLFIDADHDYERVASDWRLWAPHVRAGGHVALHDSVVFPGGWTREETGPVKLLAEIRREAREWEVIEQADSVSILHRRETSQPLPIS